MIWTKWFSLENDLAPYSIKYKCDQDCSFGGCPGHTARFVNNSTSDIFSIHWRVGEEGEYTTSFDLVQFSLVEDFMQRLKTI